MKLPLAELNLAPRESMMLTGSHARKEADEWSDVDLWVLGQEEKRSQSFFSEGHLHTIKHSTLAHLQGEMLKPGSAPFVVPAVRQAMIIRDPLGEAATLQKEAQAWHWGIVEPQIPQWLGERLNGMIEDVLKVRGAISNSNWDRGYDPLQVLIFGCTEAMIVGLRLLPSTQNRYFAEVRSALGSDHEWCVSLGNATGMLRPISILESMRAGVALFCHTFRILQSQLPTEGPFAADDCLLTILKLGKFL